MSFPCTKPSTYHNWYTLGLSPVQNGALNTIGTPKATLLYKTEAGELQNEFKVDDIEPAVEFAADLSEY